MNVSQGDYIVLDQGGKPALAKCIFSENKQYKAVFEKEKENEDRAPQAVRFELADVMSNLGKRPSLGSVYGQKVEPLRKRITDVKYWDMIKMYQVMDDRQTSALKQELVICYDRLRELRVAGVKMDLEIRQPQGKMAGWYKHKPKADRDVMCVKPQANLEEFQYVVFHEYAHAIWYRMMTPRARFAWIKLYHEYITLEEVFETELNDILKEVVQAGNIGDFMSDCDDQSLLVMKSALKHIMNIHGLNKQHLNMALAQGESIEDYWPTSMELSEKEVCITEYARKSPEELWAECFAFFANKRKLPKKAQALLETTMTRLVKPSTSSESKSIPTKANKKIVDETVEVSTKKKSTKGARGGPKGLK